MSNLSYSAPDDSAAGGGNLLPAARQAAADAGAPEPAPTGPAGATATMAPVVKDAWDKTPRNAPCPCGSGKKFKLCHGKA